jgi:hypothetical protein
LRDAVIRARQRLSVVIAEGGVKLPLVARSTLKDAPDWHETGEELLDAARSTGRTSCRHVIKIENLIE